MKIRSDPTGVRPKGHVERAKRSVGSATAGQVRELPKEPPLPSHAEFGKKGPAKGGVPAWSAYVASKTTSDPGMHALQQRFDQIERLSAQGVKVRCVFDLDNTLFDTRWRTLACARAWDREQGSGWFSSLSDEQLVGAIAKNGRDTATGLGLPADVVTAFGAYWDEAFWRPENLVFDRPMDPPLNLVAEALARGAEVVFLSGRVERHVTASGEVIGFRDASLEQLRAAGVDVEDAQLVLKADVSVKTAHFKAEVLRRFDHEGEIGFFFTEGIRDTTEVRAALPETACFLLGCSFEGGARPDGVPVLPGRF
ncbi:MAG: hypothetical protein HYS27_21075 [Deltaproteobacteria bacterium]|nr:hypothetical protein [Deltaproteobacteria bacterium]